MSLEVYESCPELLKNVSALSLRVGFAEWISTPFSHLKQPQKTRCMAGSFYLFRICSFSAVARTSEDTRWEIDVLSNCRLLGGGFFCGASTWFCRLVTFFITDCLKHLFVGWALWSTLIIFFQSQGLSILCIREAGCYCFPLAQLLLNGVSETHSDWSSCEQALSTSALMMEHCKMCTCLSIIWVLGWFDIMRCILRFCRHELWDTGGYIHDAMCMIFIIG